MHDTFTVDAGGMRAATTTQAMQIARAMHINAEAVRQAASRPFDLLILVCRFPHYCLGAHNVIQQYRTVQ